MSKTASMSYFVDVNFGVYFEMSFLAVISGGHLMGHFLEVIYRGHKGDLGMVK